MAGKNEKYLLELEVLSPLHIGAGSEKDWIKGADYIHIKDKIYHLDIAKVANAISVDVLSNCLVNRDEAGLISKLGGRLNSCTYPDGIFTMPFQSDNPIKTFFKNGLLHKPIFPGSSLKGAIRSILFNSLRINETSDNMIFGSSTEGDDFMRFFKFSDASFDKTSLVNSKVYNLTGYRAPFTGGWKHSGGFNGRTNNTFNHIGFNTIYETINPKQKSLISLSFDKIAFNNFGIEKFSEKKKSIMSGGIETLFDIINKHTKNYLLKEAAFFSKYNQGENSEKILKQIDHLIKQIPNDNSSCILKMAAGSGFHSITGDWQFNDYEIDSIDTNKRNRGNRHGKPSAKSRKIAIDSDNNFYLMGFVKLSIYDANIPFDIHTNETTENNLLSKVNTISEPVVKDIPVKDINLLKDNDEVMAEVIGQDGIMCKVKLNVSGLSNSEVKFRYPAGFQNGTLIICSITFPNKKNKLQFNLYFRRSL